MMKREPIPAALLRTLVSAAGGDTSLACGAELSRLGWTLVYGGFVLRSARVPGPRYFQTLEALVRVAAASGFETVTVHARELFGEKDQAEKHQALKQQVEKHQVEKRPAKRKRKSS